MAYLIKTNKHTNITYNLSINDINDRLGEESFRIAFADTITLAKLILSSKKDKAGEPMYQHAFRMAAAASLIGFSNRTIETALMHDLIEDCIEPKSVRNLIKNRYG